MQDKNSQPYHHSGLSSFISVFCESYSNWRKLNTTEMECTVCIQAWIRAQLTRN